MLKFNEQKQIDSVNGALALRSQIEKVVDEIQKRGFDGIYFVGIIHDQSCPEKNFGSLDDTFAHCRRKCAL